VTCTATDSYFVFNTPDLINQDKAKQDMTPCVQAAPAAHATFALDGWTSYQGPLNADGQHAQRRENPDHREPVGQGP
jgi:hypothetical protein